MSITTVAGIVSGTRRKNSVIKSLNASGNQFSSSWGVGSLPGAGSFDTTLNGVTLTAPVTGQIPLEDPASGNTYLISLRGRPFGASSRANQGLILLCDRLWHNGGYTPNITSAQNSTTPTWPARDISGSTDGDGVFIGWHVSSVGSSAVDATLTYTNSAGVGGRTATLTSVPQSGANCVNLFGLQAGDTGVRSVESFTLSSSHAGSGDIIKLFAYRIIAAMTIRGDRIAALDYVSGNFSRIYNGSVLFLMGIGGNTPINFGGSVEVVQG